MSQSNNPDNKLRNLHNALAYNSVGEPVLRVLWQGGESTMDNPRDRPNNLHLAMAYNSDGDPAVRVLAQGAGAPVTLASFSVTVVTPDGHGDLSYDNTTGVFTFTPANELGNLSVGNDPGADPADTNLQTIIGSVDGGDIVLSPLNGSVQVPGLKIGYLGTLLNSSLVIEAYITTYELTSIVNYSTTLPLPIGEYGNINGVPAPWTVFELAPGVSGVPVSAVDINDILTGAGIVPSVIKDRGLATSFNATSLTSGAGASKTFALGGPLDTMPLNWTATGGGIAGTAGIISITVGVSFTTVVFDQSFTATGPITFTDPATSEWSNYVIVDLDLSQLGQVLPIPGALFNLTRPLEKPNLNIQTATSTDIFLDSQGLGDVIVNTNVLPVATNISNLGSPERRWKAIYLGPGTIYVLDETLGVDIAIGARDGLLYIQNGNGLQVGEFTLVDNQIRIADPTRDILIGSSGATASVVFNRAIKVKDSLGNLAFEVDRTGLTTIRTPSGISNQDATLSIVGTANGHVQPRPNVYDGTLIQLTAQDGKSSRISSDSFGTGVYPLYAGRAARGDVDNPSAIQSNDIISRFSGVGYGTTDYKSGIIRLDMLAAENFTDSAAGTKFGFQTTPTGATAAQLSATINSTGVSFENATAANAGITFRLGTRLTYFPNPVGETDKWLKSDGTTMSWQTLPTFSGAVVYKGSWNAFSNTPALSTTTPVGLVAGWEYSISTTGTRDIGSGSQTYAAGGFVIFNGTIWEYIPPVTGVSSIQFDGGSVQTGVVQVQSADITSTLDTGSIANAKLANSSVTVTAGTGLSGGGTVSLGGSITLTNAGITSIVAGTGIGVSGSNGTRTVTNTGVLSVSGTNHISASVVSGAVTVTSDATAADTNNTIALRDIAGGLTAKDFTATYDAGISTDHGPFNYGTLSYVDTGIMADFSYSTNSYNQVVLQNRNAGPSASANYIVSNNQGTSSTYYGEFGMNSSGFSGSGSFALPNAVYLASVSSDLVIGTLSTNTLRFVTNNSGTDAVSINSSGVATFANKITGSISGNADGTSGTTLSLSNHTTTDLAEGTNKYYLDSRARGAISGGTGISYSSLDGIINSTITQYTDAQARAAIGVSGSLSYSSVSGIISYTTPTYTITTGSPSGAGALSLVGTVFTFNPSSYVGTVTGVGSTTLTIGGTSTTPTVNLTSGIVTAGTTGSSSLVPVITVDTYGRVTAISTAPNPQGTVTGIVTTTLTVGGTSTTPTVNLTSGIVTAGTTGSSSLVPVVTVDTYGRVTAITTAANPQGTVTSLGSTTLTIGGTSATPTVNLTSGIVTTGTTGSSSLIPVVTLDTYGRVTAITTAANPQGTVTSITASSTPVNGLSLSGGTITSTGTIAITGTLSGITNSNLSGSAGITNANLANSTISGVSLGGSLYNLTAGTGISFSSGSTYNGSAAITISTPYNGTVTSVSGTGTVSGLTLTGTVTTTGNLTLGGTIDKASASTFGIAKVDNTTITASAGVISAVPYSGYGNGTLYYALNATYTIGNTTANTMYSLFGVGATVTANTRYEFELVFTANGPNKHHTLFSLSGVATPTRVSFWANNTTETGSSGTLIYSTKTTGFATGVDICLANVAGTEYAHRIVGLIDIGSTGGTLIPNIGFNSNGTGVTVNAQSWIRLTPVSATGANTVIGTWS